MTEKDLNSLFTTDTYPSDIFNFEVAGYDVMVKNNLLGEALNTLSTESRNIILMSYFLDMSDAEIGTTLNVVRTTVFKHRKTALSDYEFDNIHFVVKSQFSGTFSLAKLIFQLIVKNEQEKNLVIR